MSGRYRKLVTAIGLAAFAVLGIVGVRALQTRSDQLEQYAAYRSDIHRQNAEYRIERVCPSAPSQVDCVDQTRQAKRDNQRAEQDLAAQKVTAWWTQVMGIAALIGMALSAVGVWLVKTTFDETRRSNEIAETTHRESLQPYIFVAKGDFQIDSDFQPIIHLELKNFGQSPAIDVQTWYHIWVERFPLQIELPIPPNDMPNANAVIGPGGTSEVVHPRGNPLNGYERDELVAGRAAMYVYGESIYRDNYGERYKSQFTLFASGREAMLRRRLAPYRQGNLIEKTIDSAKKG